MPNQERISDDEPISLEPQQAPQPREDEDEPISLVATGASGATALRAFGAAAGAAVRREEYKRPLNVSGQGATRCRLFRSKLAVAPLEHLEQSVNEWLDANEIEIKHVGHVIGTLEGKRPEPNLILMVWY